MKSLTLKRVVACSFLPLLLVMNTFAAENKTSKLTIKWQEPDKFTDIRPANESNKSFRKRTFKSLEAHFNKLASKLPSSYHLNITVKDVDLAGDVRPFFQPTFRNIRIVKSIYFPRMKLSYTLMDGDQLIAKEDVVLSDLSFNNLYRRYAYQDGLHFDKLMIKKWFEKDILKKIPQLNKQAKL